MKELSQELLVEQKKASRKPAFRLTISPFLKPGHSAVVQWSIFGWEKIFSDSTPPGPHGLAIPQDGSVNRARLAGSSCFTQRVPSPGRASDWTSWTAMGPAPSGIIAISASLSGPEVIMFSSIGGYLSYRRSADNGQNYADWIPIGTIVADSCIAACHKNATEMALVFAASSDHALQIVTRNASLAWSAPYILPQSPLIVSAAVFFDGDYNIVALVNRNNIYSLARVVFGQGYRVPLNSWSDVVYLNMASATVDSLDLTNQYIEGLPPNSDFQAARNEYDLKTFDPQGMSKRELQAWWAAHPGALPGRINDYVREMYFGAGHWTPVDSITLARATDNLDLDAPFICKPPGRPPLMTFIRINERWTYRLRPGTDFYDAEWAQAYKQGTGAIYGLAIACDDNFVWGTRADEVWMMPVPGSLQIPPQPGAQELTPVEAPWADIIKVEERTRLETAGELYIELDNTDKHYFEGQGAIINKGYLVRLKYGYSGKGLELLSPGHAYFIEDITYSADAGRASVILHCIDAWGLLEHFSMPAPAEINLAGNEYCIYDLLDKLLQCVGGKIRYRSRSSQITALYPRMILRAGESAAGIIKRLLLVAPDMLIFDGLDAIIINPQVSDPPVYAYFLQGRR